MSLLVDLLRFLNVFSAGIAAGTFVLVLLALIPIVGRLAPSAGLQVDRALDPLVDRYNPAAVMPSLFTASPSAATCRGRRWRCTPSARGRWSGS